MQTHRQWMENCSLTSRLTPLLDRPQDLKLFIDGFEADSFFTNAYNDYKSKVLIKQQVPEEKFLFMLLQEIAPHNYLWGHPEERTTAFKKFDNIRTSLLTNFSSDVALKFYKNLNQFFSNKLNELGCLEDYSCLERIIETIIEFSCPEEYQKARDEKNHNRILQWYNDIALPDTPDATPDTPDPNPKTSLTEAFSRFFRKFFPGNNNVPYKNF